MRRIQRATRVLGGSVLFLLASAAHAAEQKFGPPTGVAESFSIDCLPCGLLGIINVALSLVAVVSLGFIVWGGFRYITSRGDNTAVEEAKSIITNAVIGIVVIGIAAAIVNFVIGAVLAR